MNKANKQSLLENIDKEYVQLLKGDCIPVMESLVKKGIKVDAIITDPPYNISKDNNFSTMTSAKRQGVDFGKWDKGFDLFSWMNTADKLLKDGGNIIIFNSFLNIGNISTYLEKMGYHVKDLIRWIKPNPMPRNMNSRFVSDYELAIWCVKGKKKWTFNNPGDGYLRPEIKCPSPSGRERLGHPTQKPVCLMGELVKIFTNKDNVVLDPFMGSGSTGIACVKQNRHFIGIELDDGYYNMAYKRIFNDV
ncbi:MAG: site-specific DNA-methyltransferase [Rickettsiales bacterium]|jgi:DNA modification methylase|nr:site-specific DNA-methyltransferase [Rickettsiales bacterium]